MAGREVTRELLDIKSSDAVLAVRDAFEKVEAIFEFLANNPSNASGGDPLTLPTTPTDPMDTTTAPGKFGYTDDEAYLIRYVFEGLHGLGVKPFLDAGRKLTGLE